MTNSNGNNSDRLDRIEAIVESNSRVIQAMLEQQATARQRQEETERIVESNSRAIQAMMEQQATDRLKREEEKAQHEQRMARLEDTVIRLDDTVARLTRIEEAQNRMLTSMDEDRPTVLRRLMSIENKVDTLIDRNQ
jgi:beta-phosphoglucomutase-like phosphatase (HAD superfamily)